MISSIRKYIVGSQLEGLARRLYIRFDQSKWSRYDRQTLAIMKRCLRRDANCVDIGAHRGTILGEIVRIAPAGEHYAFEPIPQHYQYLVKTFPKVHLYQLALSNTKQRTTFLHDLQHPTRSSFKVPEGLNKPFETITVQTDRLDNIIPRTLQSPLLSLMSKAPSTWCYKARPRPSGRTSH